LVRVFTCFSQDIIVHEVTQPVALERPANPAAEDKSAFEEVQGILNVGPDAELVILKKVLRVSIERGTIGRAATIRLAVPDNRRRRRIAGRIVIHDDETRAARAVAQTRLPGCCKFLVDARTLVTRSDIRDP